jgi:hypothetical protein
VQHTCTFASCYIYVTCQNWWAIFHVFFQHCTVQHWNYVSSHIDVTTVLICDNVVWSPDPTVVQNIGRTANMNKKFTLSMFYKFFSAICSELLCMKLVTQPASHNCLLQKKLLNTYKSQLLLWTTGCLCLEHDKIKHQIEASNGCLFYFVLL